MITLTENATKHIKTLLADPGGCSGMEYGMAFDDRMASRSSSIP